MIPKKVCIFMLSLMPLTIVAQEEYFPSENIADCPGAVEILNPGSYQIQFTGNAGLLKDLSAYPQMSDVQEKNSLFFKFTAPFDGKLTLDAGISSGLVQLFVFQNQTEDIVSDLLNGTAVLKREVRNPSESHVGLAYIPEQNKRMALDLKTDETVLILFNTVKKEEKILSFHLEFKIREDAVNSDAYIKVVDQRKEQNNSTFHILVRDAETGNPVIADLNIKEKRRSNLYSGSDFYFNADAYSKLVIKCDAPGYFFMDENVTVYADSSKELRINMRPLSQGKVLKIDKIEFLRGTADLLPGAEPILNRVKDFLVLNADLKIEIQGHVNNEGSDNLTSKKLSKKRARKIMRYFIQSGINRKRLDYKGFGNNHPVYLHPRSEREEQANRRVEIKIL